MNLFISSRKLLAILMLFATITVNAQMQETDTIAKTEHKITSLQDFMKQSEWHFHSRTFFMSTINEGVLKDDYTLAQGAGIGLITTPIKGFQLGVSGYFIFNIASSDLDRPDKSTGSINRYELGQYDLTDILNKKNLHRLEDLFLRYTFQKNLLTLGKMELQTPFMNMQDGRMRPTIEEGAWLNINQSEKIGFNGGFIWSISPRSTVEWFKASNSIGIYPQGLNITGSKSNYKDNIESAGMAIANVYYKPFKGIEINIWDGYLENVMNTTMIDVKNENNLSPKIKLYEAVMLIRQDAINNGGNLDQNKTYINKGAKANVVSTRIGIKNKKIDWNINYTHITKDGRYLMPREWGRDPFYTFMPRERNEGTGGVNAFSSNFTVNSFNRHLKSGIGYGYFSLPDVTKFELNKYGMPSYHQINISSSYNFDKFWKGLEIRTLMAGKLNADDGKLAPKFIYNKVNMLNFNLIVDIKL